MFQINAYMGRRANSLAKNRRVLLRPALLYLLNITIWRKFPAWSEPKPFHNGTVLSLAVSNRYSFRGIFTSIKLCHFGRRRCQFGISGTTTIIGLQSRG